MSTQYDDLGALDRAFKSATKWLRKRGGTYHCWLHFTDGRISYTEVREGIGIKHVIDDRKNSKAA